MEMLHVKFSAEDFDKLVHSGVKQSSEVTIAVKDNATVSGHPGAVISFQVCIKGSFYQVQAVTTLRLLLRQLELMQTRYPEL